ncbi:hypothetical protein I204_07492 [Kwoniella mangroviensis CBS 8886]|uniref:hypothetical protein n=1 Tax=Kwoniella mangroviensis CBS 8507 TaxID=1296122 RepID=UPI00080CE3C4|nr:uncharacterized protein I203_08453 [Kwoniella mangroviensis CBS 8507]OCF62481.1 hypothetical protein I203_08453 [Kwoniella mangroviensis CBS 8507]OCF72227.1 hypothetical protein I204_07492 [Kwoniella mangroviensis CBS 8886]
MQVVAQKGMEGMIYASRDVFLLDHFPCRMVELVAWVAGVDHKDTSMTITLDDGDGQHILPVLLRLSPITHTHNSSSSRSKSYTDKAVTARTTFATLSERESRAYAKRKAPEENWSNTNGYPKIFHPKDIRVGDTVRITGKVDEWMRKKSDGSGEWVRQVVVDENAGGFISIVDPDTQYAHTSQVDHLHQTLYSRPFTLPDLSISTKTPPISPDRDTSVSRVNPTMSDGLGTTLTSEAPSELSMTDAEPELRDPTKLRSSQLTDRTFRQYMLDHMTQETIKSIRKAQEIGPEVLRGELEYYFTEYRDVQVDSYTNGRSRTLGKNSNGSGVFTNSTKVNTPSSSTSIDHATTPTQKTFISRRNPVKSTSTPCSLGLLRPFNPSSILVDERLSTLARLVVDNEIRREERRRRRRIRDGTATRKDLLVDRERNTSTNGVMIDEKERNKKIERLVSWAIRNVSDEGNLVQVTLPSPPLPSSTRHNHNDGYVTQDRYGYLPLPSQLLLPLLIPHLLAERDLRKNSIRRKTDFKSVNGMTVDELTSVMRKWGQEGRWERVGDWNIEDALEYGVGRGILRKEGVGYWVVESM